MKKNSTLLVTGGAGYIGSHTVVELLKAGQNVVILDDFSNSTPKVVERITELAGRAPVVVEGDVGDRALVTDLLSKHPIDATIHFAGFKAVGESVAKPLAYYRNNVSGTIVLLECLEAAGARRFVFSSSATVYGDPASVPIREDFPTGPTNPYGRTKWHIEHILGDLAVANPAWAIGVLRYFNPVGAHPSGRIGEDPKGIPNNLMPFVTQVAVGKRPMLSVFGGDYPTPDGTGVRDYIHVVDLALGHLAALERVMLEPGAWTVNLGTGTGYSVLDIVKAFEEASGQKIPYQIVDRRPGDIAQCYADPTLAAEKLGWRAERDLAQMCADSWRWQSQNPDGY
ncbi:MAG: UDP-glucose 4-epimerase GalE [Lautropia sp.]|nr:UDP-glucose 4-epimerase GalE [Lautropia sp.]